MRFYRLQNQDRGQRIELQLASKRQVARRCPLDPDHPSIAADEHESLCAILPDARVSGFAWAWGGDCLITDEVATLFQSEHLTGYALSPVTIAKVRSTQGDVTKVPRLWIIKLTGWGGIASDDAGINLIEPRCPECGYSQYGPIEYPGKLLDPTRWDGSDFFLIWPLPGFIFVTERVVDVVKHHRISNVEFVPIEKVEIPYFALSPGRLSFYMSKERAKELGGLLGID